MHEQREVIGFVRLQSDPLRTTAPVDHGKRNLSFGRASSLTHSTQYHQTIAVLHVQPGKPRQNAYIERYNRSARHEWLGQYNFATITEVQNHATRCLWTYNNGRPNMGIGGITPAQKLKRKMTTQMAA